MTAPRSLPTLPPATSFDSASKQSAAFHGAILDLSALRLDRCPLDLIDHKLQRRLQVLPLCTRGKTLAVALADPHNQEVINDVKFHTGRAICPVRVDCQTLQAAIEASPAIRGPVKSPATDRNQRSSASEASARDRPLPAAHTQTDPVAPIIAFINEVLQRAIEQDASDIHFEPFETGIRIRIRRDGVLYTFLDKAPALAPRISSRLKVMAGMDISEKRLPQDGQFSWQMRNGQLANIRVNSLPTLWGEKLVLRVQQFDTARLTLDYLGMHPMQRKLYQAALRQQQGMILITGPTGSGKSLSLYCGLKILNHTSINIATVENPVEIRLPGINQVQVNERSGLDFATVLRAFLRQDPDVIMVGEIRDPITADIAIKAAQTGHLVLSTLHTKSAAETLTRLRQMGVSSYNLATSISLVIAQRLARRLCDRCKAPLALPRQVLLEQGFSRASLDRLRIHQPTGCEHCQQGYCGRIGIYEVVPISSSLSRIIMKNGSSLEIAAQARKEHRAGLRAAALHRAAQGLTSLDEVNRLT